MSPTEDDGALIITFPRAWTADQRLAFMADVARALARERWAHVGERMGTDSIDATATERRSVFARLRRAAPEGCGHPRVDSMWAAAEAVSESEPLGTRVAEGARARS